MAGSGRNMPLLAPRQIASGMAAISKPLSYIEKLRIWADSMIRARLLAIPAAILCLLSTAWMYYSFRLHVAANVNMRREYQGFEQRVERTLMMAPQDFRQVLVNTGIATESHDQLVLAGTSQDETFEQMQRRVTEQFRLPMWPGVVGALTGFTFLVLAIALRNPERDA